MGGIRQKASPGTLKSKVFAAQPLGKAFDHYDMARIVDLTYGNPGYQPPRFPSIGAGKLPFLVGNEGGSQALDAGHRNDADSAMKDVTSCLACMHDPGTFQAHDRAAERARGARQHRKRRGRCGDLAVGAIPLLAATTWLSRELITGEAATASWRTYPMRFSILGWI